MLILGDDKKKHANFKPNSTAMKQWKKKYYDKDEAEIVTASSDKYDTKSGEDERSVIIEDKDIIADMTHKKFCLIMMGMALGGGIFALIGYGVGPRSCDNDSIFEILGVVAFWISMVGIPINIIILLSSITDVESDSFAIFKWSIIHAVFWFAVLLLFSGAIFQDVFCGACMGFPGEDCS